MANIHVTYEQMEQAATELRAGQEDLVMTLERLRAQVQHLVANGFTTTRASGAFDAASEEFIRGAKQTVSGVTGMARFLDGAAEVLRNTDEQLARSIEGHMH